MSRAEEGEQAAEDEDESEQATTVEQHENVATPMLLVEALTPISSCS